MGNHWLQLHNNFLVMDKAIRLLIGGYDTSIDYRLHDSDLSSLRPPSHVAVSFTKRNLNHREISLEL